MSSIKLSQQETQNLADAYKSNTLYTSSYLSGPIQQYSFADKVADHKHQFYMMFIAGLLTAVYLRWFQNTEPPEYIYSG